MPPPAAAPGLRPTRPLLE